MINTIFRIFQKQRSKDLYRYSKELNTCYIDVEIDFYRELYNEWDFSPITNRDLDEELFEFLESSVEDISPKYNICIVFNIPENLKDAEKEEKSIQGFLNYFNYEIRKQNNKIRKTANHAITCGIYGLMFLFAGTFATQYLETHELYAKFSFLAEGLIIGGWVFGWHLIEIIFFRSEELFSQKKILERLRDAKIEFNYRQSA
ncbi:MAG: hypothetical protein WCT49_00470 [Candidatus Paceibacterota bacterium]|jgi:hypothetical protein|nr:hypothetical protein [Candidatus Paceibacterota bacterium]